MGGGTLVVVVVVVAASGGCVVVVTTAMVVVVASVYSDCASIMHCWAHPRQDSQQPPASSGLLHRRLS
jgi:hypothetical protein